jgi:hypothetical protein
MTAHRFLAVSAYRGGHKAFCTCGWRDYAATAEEAYEALDEHLAEPDGDDVSQVSPCA